MRDVRERLRDILEAIDRIERYTSRGIGEAARAIPDDVRSVATDIPWPKITGMRHILVHDYFGIDLGLVWVVVQDELRPLREGVRRLLIALGVTMES